MEKDAYRLEKKKPNGEKVWIGDFHNHRLARDVLDMLFYQDDEGTHYKIIKLLSDGIGGIVLDDTENNISIES